MESVPAAGETLSARLRRETKAAHEAIEGRLNFLNAGLTVDRYAELLRRWLGFYAAWEPAAAPWLAQHGDFFARRTRIGFLTRDLERLGAGTAVPVCDLGTLAPHDEAAALGTLYVTEGSTLGGQLIARRLKELLGFGPENGAAFFATYGPDIGSMWQETKRMLDDAGRRLDGGAVVAAANNTFRFLAEWLAG